MPSSSLIWPSRSHRSMTTFALSLTDAPPTARPCRQSPPLRALLSPLRFQQAEVKYPKYHRPEAAVNGEPCGHPPTSLFAVLTTRLPGHAAVPVPLPAERAVAATWASLEGSTVALCYLEPVLLLVVPDRLGSRRATT